MGNSLGGSDRENIDAAKEGLDREQRVLHDPNSSLEDKDRAGTQASVWKRVLNNYGKD